ncbi:dihydrodipicolinate synthase family protein [Terrabacter sp. NPDC080008]|uniref:dihydrodipicolinate synthase family protein n=1 Tax=Terrabacter sp. NPDC080008 TaxID=3155176 RepID=UPI00344C87C8
MTHVVLPTESGGSRVLELAGPRDWVRPDRPITSRVAYAAAHVVPRVLADSTPGSPADVDWDATLELRRDLWSWGLGVAEAMDTAQRGMGLDWTATRELIERSAAEARRLGGRIASGAGTDQLDPGRATPDADGLRAVAAAYTEQVKVVEAAGSGVIVMASRALARAATSPTDYVRVYEEVLDVASAPVILHWLGEMFDPELAGYWGSRDLDAATDAFLDLVTRNAERVDGVKVSLLDADHERRLRRALPDGVRLYTGDDFNYPELVCDDEHGVHSDALLGIFAAIAPAASTALQALDRGDEATAREVLESTRALGRHVFAAPTRFYKTGIAFLAWLNGRQPGFQMVGGLSTGRSVLHLVRALELAEQAGLVAEPDLAARRVTAWLAANGWEAP